MLLILYYLCTIKASRQEQASRSGLIPHLQRAIKENNPFKQFALAIFFQLAKTSRRTRTELKKYNGVSFLLDLLMDQYWCTNALDSLALWLGDDPRRVEFILSSQASIGKLVYLVRETTEATQFDRILPPFLQIVMLSPTINSALSRAPSFVQLLLTRLQLHADSNSIRISILKILTSLYENDKNPKEFVARHNLVPILSNLAKDSSARIIAQLASRLLQQIQDGQGAAPSS